eukprot:CAMPEP_0204834900 /NCGR_PEP_ID=MMETSP1346-20131115/21125_1 /ASSEMBLY_ACC=CAM_ASM_000771 /TAXON_ID=215587 /ORGANISM="Aplanochytrium stocchinoi, Strain GSBS06" /LENGTH=370 /DNA_ID=CAMNT_0051968495 /DNA_START=138 /DNA_END=1250 /DNA_ORIENTATION=-
MGSKGGFVNVVLFHFHGNKVSVSYPGGPAFYQLNTRDNTAHAANTNAHIGELLKVAISSEIVQEHVKDIKYFVVASPFNRKKNPTYFGRRETVMFEFIDWTEYLDFGKDRMCLSVSEDELAFRSLRDPTAPNIYTLNVTRTNVYVSLFPNQSWTTNRTEPGPQPVNGDELKFGADTITEYFIKLLCEKGYDLTSAEAGMREFARKLVREHCYCALDYTAECERLESQGNIEVEVELPDGTTLPLGKELFQAPEILFRPSLIGLEDVGVAELFRDLAFRHTISKGWNVVLLMAGEFAGNLPGFKERFQNEFSGLPDTNIRTYSVESLDASDGVDASAGAAYFTAADFEDQKTLFKTSSIDDDAVSLFGLFE